MSLDIAILIGGPAAILATLFAASHPRTWLAFNVLAVTFGPFLATLMNIEPLRSSGTWLLPITLVGTILYGLTRGGLTRPPGYQWFALFLFLGAVSSVVENVPFSTAASGFVGIAKGMILGFCAFQLPWSDKYIRKVIAISMVCLSIIFLLVLANVIIPNYWASRFGNEVEYRNGLPAILGPFYYPAALGRFMALATIAILAYRTTVGKSKINTLFLTLAIASSLFSLRRKTLAGLLSGATTVLLVRFRASALVAVLVVLPIAAIALSGTITSSATTTVNAYADITNPAARTRLTLDSLRVATDSFPFGAGFGRFGSAAARSDYSPEYTSRGYTSIRGLGPGDTDGAYLTDTQWPAIWGEAGFIGAIAFVLAFAVIARGFARGRASTHAITAWLSLTGLGWLVELFFESIASPVFSSAPSFPLIFLIGAIVARRTVFDDRETQPSPRHRPIRAPSSHPRRAPR